MSLDGLGNFSRAELSAAGALIAYLELTQKGKRVALGRLARVSPENFMAIDAATRRNLELTETLSGARGGSLLATIDRSVTAAGARELASRLAAPLTDVKVIAARHDVGGIVFADIGTAPGACARLCAPRPICRGRWRGCRSQRGGPRDLGNIRDAIKAARALA